MLPPPLKLLTQPSWQCNDCMISNCKHVNWIAPSLVQKSERRENWLVSVQQHPQSDLNGTRQVLSNCQITTQRQ
eukprot:1111110-Pelagomonas_calceolata.AAC.2